MGHAAASRREVYHSPDRPMDGSPWLQRVHAWLVATDLRFVKSSHTASKRVPTRASSDGEEHATADSRSDDSDGGDDEDEDAALNDEDSPADADADGAAATAGNDEADGTCLLAWLTCDLASPFLLAGIHGSSVAQEAPTGEAPQPSSDNDDATAIAEAWKKIDETLFNC